MEEMKCPPLKAGDVFATKNPMMLGRAINAIQSFWADDSKSNYSHTGIILGPTGETLESLWKVTNRNIFRDYVGKKILIARPKSAIRKETALKTIIGQHKNQIYPVWRLAFHLIPPLARHVSLGGRFLVCSELVAKYLYLIDMRHEYYMGTNPDTLADEWRTWKIFDVIFEGILEEEK
jgi:hypothetical protein